MFGLHDCDLTPPEKVDAIKKEMESYLDLNKTQNSTKHEVCNFCRVKRADLSAGGSLLQCTGCRSVAYVSAFLYNMSCQYSSRIHTDVLNPSSRIIKCSKDCQQWDWSSEHKSKCGKN